ncbi:MAG: AraC family transcriptional regulator [Cyclobacteriaceae bacterium]
MSQLESVKTLIGFLHWFVFAQFLFYIVLMSIYWVKKIYHRNNELDKVQWIKILIISCGVIWFLALVMQVINVDHEDWNYVWLVAAIFIYTCGYIALRKPTLFRDDLRIQKKPEEKYEKSALTDDIAIVYKIAMLQYIENEKPYLKHDLTLPKLADHLKISHHYISQIINVHFNKNFFEFINRYRVEHAEQLMHDPQYSSKNLSTIGYLSGFNTTSVFNAAFKKELHQTPKQFRKNLKKD